MFPVCWVRFMFSCGNGSTHVFLVFPGMWVEKFLVVPVDLVLSLILLLYTGVGRVFCRCVGVLDGVRS